jgi:hypothetical protein
MFRTVKRDARCVSSDECGPPLKLTTEITGDTEFRIILSVRSVVQTTGTFQMAHCNFPSSPGALRGMLRA